MHPLCRIRIDLRVGALFDMLYDVDGNYRDMSSVHFCLGAGWLRESTLEHLLTMSSKYMSLQWILRSALHAPPGPSADGPSMGCGGGGGGKSLMPGGQPPPPGLTAAIAELRERNFLYQQ